MIHKYTWYSNDEKMQCNIIDFILAELYDKNYMVHQNPVCPTVF